MLKVEIDQDYFGGDPRDWGFELYRALEDVARQVRGYEGGCGEIGGPVRAAMGQVIGSWSALSELSPDDIRELRRLQGRG
jgi:hypothetical protein